MGDVRYAAVFCCALCICPGFQLRLVVVVASTKLAQKKEGAVICYIFFINYKNNKNINTNTNITLRHKTAQAQLQLQLQQRKTTKRAKTKQRAR